MKISKSEQRVIPEMTAYDLSEIELTEAVMHYAKCGGPIYRLQVHPGFGATLWVGEKIAQTEKISV